MYFNYRIFDRNVLYILWHIFYVHIFHVEILVVLHSYSFKDALGIRSNLKVKFVMN